MDSSSLNPIAGGMTDQGTEPRDDLIQNHVADLVTEMATLISGQNVARGTVLGKITASGKLTLALSASSDGSQNVYAIAAQDCDASGGDKSIVVYLSGQFNSSKMTFGTGITAANSKAAFRDLNTYI